MSGSAAHRFRCPACGEELSPNARFCRACGADGRSGWKPDADEVDTLTAAGVEDEDGFDYDAYAEREFGGGGFAKRPPFGWFWWAVAAVLAVIFGILALLGIF